MMNAPTHDAIDDRALKVQDERMNTDTRFHEISLSHLVPLGTCAGHS